MLAMLTWQPITAPSHTLQRLAVAVRALGHKVAHANAMSEQQPASFVAFKLQFGKTCTDLSMPLSATIGELKEKAQDLSGIPTAMQKLLIKGQMHPDDVSLQKAGVKKGLRLMLIGSRSCCSCFAVIICFCFC